MVDLTNKEAKRIYFSPDKNLLTSEHNHLGKSVIMKSIYYTLGAEVYYTHPMEDMPTSSAFWLAYLPLTRAYKNTTI